MSNDVDGWQFWVDRGGTFTDIVACAPSGKIQALKLLSHNPNHYEDAVVAGIRQFLRAEPNATRRIAFIKMGTTVGTNALLERHGEPTVLAITAGLHDVLRIGTQQRPDIFALDIQLTAMLYSSVVEVHERLSASGQVVVALEGFPRRTSR